MTLKPWVTKYVPKYGKYAAIFGALAILVYLIVDNFSLLEPIICAIVDVIFITVCTWLIGLVLALIAWLISQLPKLFVEGWPKITGEWFFIVFTALALIFVLLEAPAHVYMKNKLAPLEQKFSDSCQMYYSGLKCDQTAVYYRNDLLRSKNYLIAGRWWCSCLWNTELEGYDCKGDTIAFYFYNYFSLF